MHPHLYLGAKYYLLWRKVVGTWFEYCQYRYPWLKCTIQLLPVVFLCFFAQLLYKYPYIVRFIYLFTRFFFLAISVRGRWDIYDIPLSRLLVFSLVFFLGSFPCPEFITNRCKESNHTHPFHRLGTSFLGLTEKFTPLVHTFSATLEAQRGPYGTYQTV